MTNKYRKIISDYRQAVATYQSALTDGAKQEAGDRLLDLRAARERRVVRWRAVRWVRRIFQSPRAQCILLIIGNLLVEAAFSDSWKWYRRLEDAFATVLPRVFFAAAAALIIIYGVLLWRKPRLPYFRTLAAILAVSLLVRLLPHIILRER